MYHGVYSLPCAAKRVLNYWIWSSFVEMDIPSSLEWELSLWGTNQRNKSYAVRPPRQNALSSCRYVAFHTVSLTKSAAIGVNTMCKYVCCVINRTHARGVCERGHILPR